MYIAGGIQLIPILVEHEGFHINKAYHALNMSCARFDPWSKQDVSQLEFVKIVVLGHSAIMAGYWFLLLIYELLNYC